MSSLAWRIFLAFWLVIILTLVVTATANRWFLSDDVAATRAQLLAASMDGFAAEAQRALDAEGEAGLRRWVQNKQSELDASILIVSPTGRELLDRPVPPFLRGDRRGPGQAAFRGPGRRMAQRVLTSDDGEYRMLIPGLHRPGRRGAGMMGPQTRQLFPLVLILMSGGACLLLARYLTRPIDTFRHVGQQMAAGNLAARVGDPVGARTDEFGALARDFDFMADRLQSLVESKQRLLRDVSHELRSPLARLQAAVGLLRQQHDQSADHNLDRIETETQKMDEMIGQVLAFARLESADTIRRESVDLIDVIHDVVDNAIYEAKTLGKDVRLDAPENLTLQLDADLIRSAFDNVVRNAVQHATRLVTVTVSGTAEQVSVHVADDGAGADPEILERLFEPFFTTAPSNSAAGKGAGIGLAIAQRAVALHGGEISARNHEPSGLDVVIELPR